MPDRPWAKREGTACSRPSAVRDARLGPACMPVLFPDALPGESIPQTLCPPLPSSPYDKLLMVNFEFWIPPHLDLLN